jgi:hypothetical protein
VVLSLGQGEQHNNGSGCESCLDPDHLCNYSVLALERLQHTVTIESKHKQISRCLFCLTVILSRFAAGTSTAGPCRHAWHACERELRRSLNSKTLKAVDVPCPPRSWWSVLAATFKVRDRSCAKQVWALSALLNQKLHMRVHGSPGHHHQPCKQP